MKPDLMRGLLLVVLVACQADPRIACTTDQQCLVGQACVQSACAAPASLAVDGPAAGSDADVGAADAATDGTGGTDAMLDAPIGCTLSSQCPLTSPCCVANTCQLLGC